MTDQVTEFPRRETGEQENPDNLLEHYVRATDLQEKVFSRTWKIEGLIEKGRVYEVFGRWKEGKTLASEDLCASVCTGQIWAGRRTEKALVVYVAGEAVEDIEMRLAAWQRKHGVTGDIPFVIRTRPVYLTDREFADRLFRELEALKHEYGGLDIVLVIDTLARNFGGGMSENSDEGMGAFVNNLLDIVVRPSGCTCLVVHHSGHGDSERGRGHSSFAGAVDGSIKVSMDKSSGQPVITVSTTTSRTTAGDDSLSFRIEVQELPGEDNFGNPVDAPILRYLPDHTPAAQPTGKHESGLYEMIAQRAQEQFQAIQANGSAAPEYVLVSIAEMREIFRASITGSENTKNTTWKRARKRALTHFGTIGGSFRVSRKQAGLACD
jgi:hypothetical protein